MNSSKIMALAIVGIMIASGFFMLIPSGVKATSATGYISWFRGGVSSPTSIGYATSTDGVVWTPYASNPILSTHWVLPYVVAYNSGYYMFIKNTTDNNLYLFNLTASHTSPSVMNGGKPVYYHSTTSSNWDYTIFNPSVAVVGGTWYMLLEGKKSSGGFMIGYAWSTFASLNWSAHRSSSAVIGTGSDDQGNPYLTYVPERSALLAVYGLNPGTYWGLRAAYGYTGTNLAVAANWTVASSATFHISDASRHICDASILTPYTSTYPVMISYSWAQVSIAQSYYTGTLLQFMDQLIAASPVSLISEPTNPNRVADTTWENGVVMEQSDFTITTETDTSSYSSSVSGLLYLIPFFLTLGVVMIPIVKIMEISKQKRMLRVDEVIRMFVTIVVGMALVGITYVMI